MDVRLTRYNTLLNMVNKQRLIQAEGSTEYLSHPHSTCTGGSQGLLHPSKAQKKELQKHMVASFMIMIAIALDLRAFMYRACHSRKIVHYVMRESPRTLLARFVFLSELDMVYRLIIPTSISCTHLLACSNFSNSTSLPIVLLTLKNDP